MKVYIRVTVRDVLQAILRAGQLDGTKFQGTRVSSRVGVKTERVVEEQSREEGMYALLKAGMTRRKEEQKERIQLAEELKELTRKMEELKKKIKRENRMEGPTFQ